jgi:signal transduction histidine kinase
MMDHNLTAFFDQHFVTIYFFSGLSFFSMGLALLIEGRRESQLALAKAAHLLGLFGLLHGAHEFVEMFVVTGLLPATTLVEAAAVCLLIVSFLPLVAFGLALLPRATENWAFVLRATALVGVAFLVQLGLLYLSYHPTFHDWLHATDTLARYTLAIPASGLVGFGLWRQRQHMIDLGMRSYGTQLAIGAAALVVYGIIGQAFPPESFLFPSMYVNADLFQRIVGFPVQMLRAVMALTAALTIIRALRAFEVEARRRLETAVETKAELQTAARELSLLYEASSLLTSTYDLETLTQKAVNRIVPIIEPVHHAAIYVPPDEHTRAGHISSCGYTPGEMEAIGHMLQDHVAYGQSTPDQAAYWVDQAGQDVSTVVKSQITTNDPPQPIALRRLVLPLRTQQHLVGSLLLETAPGGPYLSSFEAPTIIALARQLAIAIENADLVFQLRQRELIQAELLQRATVAQEAERKRIARELHDDTGQALTALALGLRGVSKLAEHDAAAFTPQIEQLQSISTDALDELRHLISDLRPSHLDDLGLVPALRWYTEQVNERGQTKFTFAVEGDAYRLPPETETTLFRIAQEGFGNVLKHAGASCAELRLRYRQTCICLQVSDDGSGFDAPAVLEPGSGQAWGLIGIQERATLAGGHMEIDSTPGEGTTLRVCIPRIEEEAPTGCEQGMEEHASAEN